MRLIIDLMAVTGFLLSASMTAGLVISVGQMDEIMRKTMERVSANVTSEIQKELDAKLDKAMPKVPGGPSKPSLY